MAELLIGDRIAFKKGGQRKFLLEVTDSLDLSWKQLSVMVGLHNRTIRDWVNEKSRMPHETAQMLSKKACVHIPKNVKIIDWQQHLMAASQKGGKAKYKKYGNVGGNEAERKKAWEKWWNEKGKLKENKILQKRPVNVPSKSADLAEFVGIMMGDGGITKYRIAVTLNSKDDYRYHIFVCKLIEKLFDVSPKIYTKKDSLVMDIVIYRKNLVKFCQSIGLKVGNKLEQRLDIPSWIKCNKKYSTACVRGLVDTDGSVFTHKYKIKGKEYKYKKLSFTSGSIPLLRSVYNILKENDIKSRLARDIDVRIDSKKDMQNYFKLFGSHNPKHLKRYSE